MIVRLRFCAFTLATHDKRIHSEALEQNLNQNEPTTLDEDCKELYDIQLAYANSRLCSRHTCTENPNRSKSISPYEAIATPIEIILTIPHSFAFAVLTLKATETASTTTGVTAYVVNLARGWCCWRRFYLDHLDEGYREPLQCLSATITRFKV